MVKAKQLVTPLRNPLVGVFIALEGLACLVFGQGVICVVWRKYILS